MKDLVSLYNAVRFYVALEGLIYSDDEIACNLYQEGKDFESFSYYEHYKHVGDALGESDFNNNLKKS